MHPNAVIDLGTNTFHLLIARKEAAGTYTELFRERRFVKLGENGVERIGDAPYARGLQTLIDFQKILEEKQVENVRVFGTAALRTAANGPDFVREVKEKTGLTVSLISGDEEARLICVGVRQAVPFTAEKMLIMDIGGGSVEFIIANDAQVFAAQSFPIGVSVLKNKFHHSNPISPAEIRAVQMHLTETLAPVREMLRNHPVSTLIGASGTFDVLENVLSKEEVTGLYSEFAAEKFYPLYDKFLTTTLEERLQMQGLPADRADMIVVALILIDYVLKIAKIEKITVSAFAMKEGMLAEM